MVGVFAHVAEPGGSVGVSDEGGFEEVMGCEHDSDGGCDGGRG